MSQENSRFEGKVAIVTGAGGGMGEVIAAAFASQGACVGVNDVDAEAAQRVVGRIVEHGGKALSIPADVTDSARIEQMVSRTVEAFGSVDILVNNAGVLYSTPVDEISEDEWDRVLDVNLKGVFLCSLAVLPVMKSRKSGKIVNMSSSAGRTTSDLGGAHYTAAKAGVLGFSRHLAREMAGHGINVNAICPGMIDTPMTRVDAFKDRLGHFVDLIPMHRMGEPAEAADLVLFLASDEASYITGATVDLNGGLLMM